MKRLRFSVFNNPSLNLIEIVYFAIYLSGLFDKTLSFQSDLGEMGQQITLAQDHAENGPPEHTMFLQAYWDHCKNSYFANS